MAIVPHKTGFHSSPLSNFTESHQSVIGHQWYSAGPKANAMPDGLYEITLTAHTRQVFDDVSSKIWFDGGTEQVIVRPFAKKDNAFSNYMVKLILQVDKGEGNELLVKSDTNYHSYYPTLTYRYIGELV